MEESGGVGLFTNKNSLSLAGCYARSLQSYRRPTDFFNQGMDGGWSGSTTLRLEQHKVENEG